MVHRFCECFLCSFADEVQYVVTEGLIDKLGFALERNLELKITWDL